MYANKEAEPIVTERDMHVRIGHTKSATRKILKMEEMIVPMVVALTTVEHRLSQTQAIGGMKLTKQEAWGCGLCVNLSLSQ